MRRSLIALSTTVLLASAGAAFAQSQQGGYLGVNPGSNQTTSAATGSEHGSGEGGYLGKNPGSMQSSSSVSPNDPSYSDNGAPRAGASASGDYYAPIQHHDQGR